MEKKSAKDPRTHQIIGAAIEVHKHLGCGFLESVYHDALAAEFHACGVPFRREVELQVFYKNIRLTASYRADFVCYDSIIVELKAVEALTGVEEAQVINYLKATGFEVGLLFNFGAASLQYKRFANSKGQQQTSA